MKAIASVAVAGLIAATSLTTTVTPADAGHKKYYYSKGWNPGGALATGAILGFAFGALATPNYYYAPKVYTYVPPPPPPPYPNYYYSYGPMNAQHVSFCKHKYRSYNIKYNTWIGFDGLVHQCISPYY